MIDDPVYEQRHRDCRDDIHKRMLLQEYCGKGDQDGKDQGGSFDDRMLQPFCVPGTEAHTQCADHMQTGTYVGIGIKSVEPGDDPDQNIIPGEFRDPEFLAGGVDQIENKRSQEGNA